MGWTVLYIAFGVVALWLLGEVLLQYKARLRWRLLAFCGFLGVVVGVLIPSVPVIGVGAIAFAIGQTYVTLSFRRGFAAGWALRGGLPGLLGRGEKRPRPDDADKEPVLEVSGLEAVPAAQPEPAAYQPQPMPDETSEYGVYDEPSPFTPASGPYSDNAAGDYSAYETYGGYGSQQDHGLDHGLGHGQEQGQGYGGQDIYADQTQAGQYGYGNEAYAAYGQQDPYGGAQPQAQPYEQQPYGHQQYTEQYAPYGQQDPYGGGDGGTLGGDHWAADASYPSPDPAYDAMGPGGPWVPQQREGDATPAADQQAYPYQQQHPGYPQGFDEQYRY
ncbi:hypothetical protein [Streptomyces sp. S465]|uniref:hypothetical protein n=1 Tax=Streptomyces sp. S465 TaxID=2979468 RepID=UPI0022A81248|nr:hypothetical protein [Streptomyces sp. S465]WAP55529.1 hypothetical protein N6H00_11355 [Streptomyces sp. S465]